MLLWLVLAQVLSTGGTSRLPPSPPSPMEDSCLVLTLELAQFRLQGEAVVLSFPFLLSQLRQHHMTLTRASVHIHRADHAPNASDSHAHQPEGRVQQRGAQLWLLPAQESDSGQYICTYRTETFCARGALTLHIYSSLFVAVEQLSYGITAVEGENLRFRCPSLGAFNSDESPVHWNKVSGPDELFGSSEGRLLIPSMRRGHGGLYRCQTTIILDHREFNMSRAVLITVQGKPLALPTDLSVTSDPGVTTTQPAPESSPPRILSPRNGTVFETSHGSGLELVCSVLLRDCPMAESTLVTWLVNGQSAESSYLEGQALQGDRRFGPGPDGCRVEVRLMILEIRARDTEAELQCVAQNQHGRQEVRVWLQLEDSTHTWLVFSCVALLCLLSVVLVFIYVLLKPGPGRTKVDYTLARQDSSFCSI